MNAMDAVLRQPAFLEPAKGVLGAVVEAGVNAPPLLERVPVHVQQLADFPKRITLAAKLAHFVQHHRFQFRGPTLARHGTEAFIFGHGVNVHNTPVNTDYLGRKH
jgi:hypothetical protein